MKKKRQAKILELIKSYDIETQEELQKKLNECGFDVTQATVSRDIKELRLVKELSIHGKYCYSIGKAHHHEKFMNRANGIFTDSIISVDYAINIVVVKCYAGMANAACAAIDAMGWPNVVGTLAGDDTFFMVCRDEEIALSYTEKLRNMVNA